MFSHLVVSILFQNSYPLLVPLAKFAVAFPLVYHYGAGVRHLYWDETASGINTNDVQLSSQILIGGSVALSILITLL